MRANHVARDILLAKGPGRIINYSIVTRPSTATLVHANFYFKFASVLAKSCPGTWLFLPSLLFSSDHSDVLN